MDFINEDFLDIIQRLSNDMKTSEDRPAEAIEDYLFEVKKSDHPLKNILGSTQDKDPFLLVYKQIQYQTDEPSQEETSSQNGSVDCSASLDGSPLKVQDYMGNVKIDKNSPGAPHMMGAIAPNKARHLLSQYNLSINGPLVEKPVLPLWIYCDRTYPGRQLFLGCKRISQGWQLYSVKCQGPIQDITEIPAHLQFGSESNQALCTVEGYAQYDIFGSMMKDANQTTSAYQGSLMLEASWSPVTTLLESPPSEAKCTLNIQVAAGDMRSAAYSMFRELTILQGFAAGFQGSVNWVVETSQVGLKDRVNSFISELKEGNTVKAKGVTYSESGEDGDSHVKHLVLEERTHLDFTEKLWNLLIDSTCYDEMVQCLQAVLSALHKGDIQPMVHQRNQTKLAKLIRDSYYGQMTMPVLSGVLPLELLVEIGIEKLKRDYSFTFMSKDLIAASHLDYYLKSDINITEQILRLEKMHNVLEMLVMMITFLDLPQVELSIAARHGLKHYETHSIDPNHIFAIPASAPAVTGVFQSLQPFTWRAQMTKDDTPLTVHHLSCRPPIQDIHSNQEIDLNTTSESQASYFYTTVEVQQIQPFS